MAKKKGILPTEAEMIQQDLEVLEMGKKLGLFPEDFTPDHLRGKKFHKGSSHKKGTLHDKRKASKKEMLRRIQYEEIL